MPNYISKIRQIVPAEIFAAYCFAYSMIEASDKTYSVKIWGVEVIISVCIMIILAFQLKSVAGWHETWFEKVCQLVKIVGKTLPSMVSFFLLAIYVAYDISASKPFGFHNFNPFGKVGISVILVIWALAIPLLGRNNNGRNSANMIILLCAMVIFPEPSYAAKAATGQIEFYSQENDARYKIGYYVNRMGTCKEQLLNLHNPPKIMFPDTDDNLNIESLGSPICVIVNHAAGEEDNKGAHAFIQVYIFLSECNMEGKVKLIRNRSGSWSTKYRQPRIWINNPTISYSDFKRNGYKNNENNGPWHVKINETDKETSQPPYIDFWKEPNECESTAMLLGFQVRDATTLKNIGSDHPLVFNVENRYIQNGTRIIINYPKKSSTRTLNLKYSWWEN